MAIYTFPAGSFEVEGNPEAVAESGRSYGRFATTAGEASAGIRGLNSGSWVGTEGDLFRSKVSQIPPHLDTANSAFAEVARALEGFASELAAAQRRMSGVRAEAEATYARLRSAQDAAERLREPSDEAVRADPSVGEAYADRKAALTGQVNSLTGTWEQHLSAAAGIRARVQAAASATGTRIRAAGRTSPTADQNWLEDKLEDGGRWIDENLAGLRDWIGEHAGVLRGIAQVMRWVGYGLAAVGAVIVGINAVISMTGIGAIVGVPGMGLGLLLMGGGLGMAGLADTVDVAVDWGEGKIDGRDLIIQGSISAAIGVASFFGVGLAANAAKQAWKAVPDSWKRNAADWITARFRRSSPSPAVRPPGPGNAPGVHTPLTPTSPQAPRRYEYRNPALSRAGAAEPEPEDLSGLRSAKHYDPGSEEHMLSSWAAYVKRKTRAGQQPWPWEKWRDTYIGNQGNDAKGKAFERAFREDHGFRESEGWRFNTEIPSSYGPRRNYDILNMDGDSPIAYELKSGADIDARQLAIDAELIRRADWQVVYVFGKQAEPAVIRRLEAAGVRFEVWHGEGVPTP